MNPSRILELHTIFWNTIQKQLPINAAHTTVAVTDLVREKKEKRRTLDTRILKSFLEVLTSSLNSFIRSSRLVFNYKQRVNEG